ncbi:hypothetical protein [Vitiosangium sp. GDMCC 1.1324]|uniref:hypothetical protein n=1 Tax=Vitiosangium sp. (strain GDMCC 1.1324) TaxID=2138576 RepID=UPI000D35323F|nr:hypothetical protein [Vitiosangium sp. GDMCC 1.1324]PTL83108.1 hypothetical protein DAT35_13935 [Vitiosangium sp. GDMCC 1.1324]
MRWLKLEVVALALAGLTVGTGCREREDAHSAAPSADGQAPAAQQERERAASREELRQRAEELADAASRTATAAGEVARQEADELDEQFQEEAPKIRENLNSAVQDTKQQARELARDLGDAGPTEAEQGTVSPQTGTVAGTVAKASGGELQLREADGKRVVLSTDGQTQVLRNGHPVGLDALQPGSEVRASYVMDGGEWKARQVDVVAPEKK